VIQVTTPRANTNTMPTTHTITGGSMAREFTGPIERRQHMLGFDLDGAPARAFCRIHAAGTCKGTEKRVSQGSAAARHLPGTDGRRR